MTDLAIQTDRLTVANGDLHIAAYLAQPVTPGPWPAVIVWQEVFGVNAHIRAVTDRIAREGYVAIAPALYQRQAPNFDVGYTAADLERGRTYKQQTTAAELLSDAQATIRYLQGLATVRGEAIATIGFCFGGHVAYLVATLPAIKATAVFYGAGIATQTPGGGPPTLTLTPQIQGILYGFFGDNDPLIPPQEIDDMQHALQQAHIRHRIFRYPASHGFFCDQRDSYQPDAATDAWTHVKALWVTALSR